MPRTNQRLPLPTELYPIGRVPGAEHRGTTKANRTTVTTWNLPIPPARRMKVCRRSNLCFVLHDIRPRTWLISEPAATAHTELACPQLKVPGDVCLAAEPNPPTKGESNPASPIAREEPTSVQSILNRPSSTPRFDDPLQYKVVHTVPIVPANSVASSATKPATSAIDVQLDDEAGPSQVTAKIDDNTHARFESLSKFRINSAKTPNPVAMSFGDNPSGTSNRWRSPQDPAAQEPAADPELAKKQQAEAQQKEADRESELLARLGQPLPNNPLSHVKVQIDQSKQLNEPQRFTDKYYGSYPESAQIEYGPRTLNYVQWRPQIGWWAAPNFYHRPLYFEEANLERYGFSYGRLQPFASAAHFFCSRVSAFRSKPARIRLANTFTRWATTGLVRAIPRCCRTTRLPPARSSTNRWRRLELHLSCRNVVTSKRPYDVFGVGNAMVDILAFVNDSFIADCQLNRGSMMLMDSEQQAEILVKLEGKPLTLSSGGSAANTMIAIAQSGGSGYYTGKVTHDPHGEFYQRDMVGAGIRFDVPLAPSASEPTGSCVVLTTPDAERTMCTHLGVSTSLSPDDIHPDHLQLCKFAYIEGYLWDVQQPRAACLETMRQARRMSIPVAFTFSDSFLIDRFADEFKSITDEFCDILFCNADEARQFCKTDSLDQCGGAWPAGRSGFFDQQRARLLRHRSRRVNSRSGLSGQGHRHRWRRRRVCGRNTIRLGSRMGAQEGSTLGELLRVPRRRESRPASAPLDRQRNRRRDGLAAR